MFYLALFCALSATPSEQGVSALIERLGSKSFSIRRDAGKQLFKIGGPALPLLEKAARSHPDQEVKKACGMLARRIYDDYIPDLPFGLPPITNLPLNEFVQVAALYQKEAESFYGCKLPIFKGVINARMITRFYLEDKVRHGATRADIQRTIKDMNRRAGLVPPLVKNRHFNEEVRKLMPKNPPWYYYYYSERQARHAAKGTPVKDKAVIKEKAPAKDK